MRVRDRATLIETCRRAIADTERNIERDEDALFTLKAALARLEREASAEYAADREYARMKDEGLRP